MQDSEHQPSDVHSLGSSSKPAAALPTVTIVEILPTRVWVEKDLWGTVHIKMQHQGMPEFDFIQIQYDYAYTSNGHQYSLTGKILALIGGATEGEYVKTSVAAAQTTTQPDVQGDAK